MSAPATLGALRRVGAISVQVPDAIGVTVPVTLVHDYKGVVLSEHPDDVEQLAYHILAAVTQARAIAASKREAQRLEERTRARLHVITRQMECRGCRELAVEDGLCDLCLEARDKAQRIVGVAGEVTL